MTMYLGDFDTSDVVRFLWNTNAVAGESITRATNGTISVYKDASTTQTTTGVTDTEDYDSLTGVHFCAIDTSADGTFYSSGSDFHVVLSGATIDGKSINAVLAHFSIQNRSHLRPATAGRTLVVDSAGLADANAVKIGPTGSGTAQTAGDLAGILGALNAAASSGDPGTTTTLVQYLKQIVNTLEGSAGIPTFPAAAAPANAVSLAEAIRQIYTEVAGLDGGALLDAAGIRSAVGLASANLDTQLTAIDDYIDTEVSVIVTAVGAIKTKTDQLTFTTANRVDCQVYGMEAGTVTAAAVATGAIDADALAADVITDIWQGTALTEAYASDGAAATPAQLLYMIWSALSEFAISGTTITCKKLDGSTTAMTFTLDSSTSPTSRTRAT